MTTPVPDWDAAYEGGAPARWYIGRPQPALARLAGSGVLFGRVPGAGCGTGEQALLAAAHGAQVVSVDISPRAIGQARAKAAGRGLPARFEVTDALNSPHSARPSTPSSTAGCSTSSTTRAAPGTSAAWHRCCAPAAPAS